MRRFFDAYYRRNPEIAWAGLLLLIFTASAIAALDASLNPENTTTRQAVAAAVTNTIKAITYIGLIGYVINEGAKLMIMNAKLKEMEQEAEAAQQRIQAANQEADAAQHRANAATREAEAAERHLANLQAEIRRTEEQQR